MRPILPPLPSAKLTPAKPPRAEPTPAEPLSERALPAVSVRALTLWLPLLTVALAATVAWLLAGPVGASPASAAALAAALGVALAAWPLAHLVRHVTMPPALPLAAPPRHDARAEPPTGFMDRATRELARAHRYGSGAALLLVDVDRAGRLDDAEVRCAVQAALDILMQQTAPTLRSADLLARFSGSQLAVLLTPADATGALDVAERIREHAEQIELPSPAVTARLARVRVTVSIGVAILRAPPADMASLIDDAGAALAAARQAGGNCVRTTPAGAARLRLSGRRDDRRTQPK